MGGPEPRTGGSEVGRPAEGSSRGWKVGAMGEGRERGLGNKGCRAPHPGRGRPRWGGEAGWRPGVGPWTAGIPAALPLARPPSAGPGTARRRPLALPLLPRRQEQQRGRRGK